MNFYAHFTDSSGHLAAVVKHKAILNISYFDHHTDTLHATIFHRACYIAHRFQRSHVVLLSSDDTFVQKVQGNSLFDEANLATVLRAAAYLSNKTLFCAQRDVLPYITIQEKRYYDSDYITKLAKASSAQLNYLSPVLGNEFGYVQTESFNSGLNRAFSSEERWNNLIRT